MRAGPLLTHNRAVFEHRKEPCVPSSSPAKFVPPRRTNAFITGEQLESYPAADCSTTCFSSASPRGVVPTARLQVDFRHDGTRSSVRKIARSQSGPRPESCRRRRVTPGQCATFSPSSQVAEKSACARRIGPLSTGFSASRPPEFLQ